MAHQLPLFVGEVKAAQLLDIKPSEFRKLVDAGHFPRGREFCGYVRWDVDELRQIVRGEAVEGGGIAW